MPIHSTAVRTARRAMVEMTFLFSRGLYYGDGCLFEDGGIEKIQRLIASRSRRLRVIVGQDHASADERSKREPSVPRFAIRQQWPTERQPDVMGIVLQRIQKPKARHGLVRRRVPV